MSSGAGARLVAAGIFLSRLTGLVRQKVFAFFLGDGLAADALSAAFRIPNLLQNLLGEGVLSASFIPVYARLRAEGRTEEAGRVAGAGLLPSQNGISDACPIKDRGECFCDPLRTLIETSGASYPK